MRVNPWIALLIATLIAAAFWALVVVGALHAVRGGR